LGHARRGATGLIDTDLPTEAISLRIPEYFKIQKMEKTNKYIVYMLQKM
jgi:hypothetical protein